MDDCLFVRCRSPSQRKVPQYVAERRAVPTRSDDEISYETFKLGILTLTLARLHLLHAVDTTIELARRLIGLFKEGVISASNVSVRSSIRSEHA